jgi:predicted dehydrogenase
MQKTPKVSRRRFLGGTAAAFGIPYVIPSGVLAVPGRPGANDRIVIGNIGLGGMGSGHVRPDAAALCDVDENHLAANAKRVQGSPLLCKDYRRVLDRKDIDAVMIAAPDHWHALMMVHACQAGKDVYVEKPACRTIEEGRAMVNAAKRYGRVVQVGSQGRSTPAAHAACEYIRNGQIGTVKRVDIWHEKNWTDGWGQETPPRPELDWEMWLRPARWQPYNTQRCHFNFRWFMDFGGGFIRDRGAHAFSIVQWCMNQDHTGPVSVEATGEPQKEGIWDVPVTMDVRYEFKNPDLTLTWSQPGRSPNGTPWGELFTGDKGTLIVTGGDAGTDTEEKAKQYQPPSNGVHLPQSADHRENWLECIRTRQQPIMPIEAGVRAASLGILGNTAFRLGRKLQWDPVNQHFVDDPEANRFLSEPYRAPWEL